MQSGRYEQKMKKNLVIFGSTGSIGKNCLEVVSRFPDRFKIVGLAANNNYQLLAEQAAQFKASSVLINNAEHQKQLRKLLPNSVMVYAGGDSLTGFLHEGDKPHLVVNAMVGSAGLMPTLETLKSGINLAIANKESLVAAGELVLKTAAENKAKLIPIDSEHSAIFQCLTGEDKSKIDRLILTASGGPFLDTPLAGFGRITPEEALNHPNWDMGERITIDSATMMNKGFEVIEAHWLFGVPTDRIDVTIHRQSIVHSIVRFRDGSYTAQIGAPDMRLPIQYALTYPERLPSPYCELDFKKSFDLNFQPPPREKFPCLGLAYNAMRSGGIAPAVLNAADETAVKAFLHHKIKFTQIPVLIEKAINQMGNAKYSTVDEILAADRETRKYLFYLF